MLNTAGEVEYSRPLVNTGIIKQLRGESSITVEFKGKPPFQMVWHGKCFFNANKFPKSPDNTVGFYRTWLIQKFENEFSTERKNIDTHLKDKLVTDEELSGLFNVVVDCFLPFLMNRDDFTFSMTVEEIADLYKRKSDSVQVFVEDRVVIDAEAMMSKPDMRKEYETFVKREGLMLDSDKGFKQTLDRLAIPYGEKQIDGVRYWKGIRAKSAEELVDADEPEPSQVPDDPQEFLCYYLSRQGIKLPNNGINRINGLFNICGKQTNIEKLKEYGENAVNPVKPVLIGSEENPVKPVNPVISGSEMTGNAIKPVKPVNPVISGSEMTGNAIKPVKPVLITSDHTSTATAGSSSHLPSGSSEASPQGQDHSPNGDGAGSPQEASPPGQPTNNGKPPDDFKAAEAMHKKAVDWWKVQPNRTGDYRGFLKTLSDSESTYGVRCINYMHRVAGELMETESNIFKLVREVLYEPPADDVDPEAYGFPQ
jgi:hypothetical protein